MAGDSTRKRKLFAKFLESIGVAGDVRINLGVGPFEVGIGDETGSAVTRTRNEDGVQVVAFDDFEP